MRVLHDPGSLLTIASTAFTVIGGVVGGAAARAQGQVEADFYRSQQEQERLALSRDQAAMEQERARTLARARAVSAAQGGDTTSGNAEGILENIWGTFGRRGAELINDSEARIRALGNRAASAQSAGRTAMWSSIFSGVAGGARSGASLLRGYSGGGSSGGSPGSLAGRSAYG